MYTVRHIYHISAATIIISVLCNSAVQYCMYADPSIHPSSPVHRCRVLSCLYVLDVANRIEETLSLHLGRYSSGWVVVI